uniref:CSON015274 protein n=1 Tax=Culicoides sonorensis TaxID=179676 RepID=A0A336MQB8_CULSO
MSSDERENLIDDRCELVMSADSGFIEITVHNEKEEEIITSLVLDEVEGTLTDKMKRISSGNSEDDDDDESAEKKEMTVTNLKETFEHLSKSSVDASVKPNWWIRQNSRGEYIIYKSKNMPPGPSKLYKKVSDPKKFLAQLSSDQYKVSINDDNEGDKISETQSTVINNDTSNENIYQNTDKILSNETSDLHTLCVGDSSSDDDDDKSENDLKTTDFDEKSQRNGSVERDSANSVKSHTSNSSLTRMLMDIESLPEKNQRQLLNVIIELIQTEKNYVNNLERGIDTYVKTLDSRAQNYPALLGKKYHIFGNIERVFAFHKEELLPALIECNNDVHLIANKFNEFITNDHFYCYVLFGLNKPRAERLTLEYKEFFDEITKSSEDKLGVNSFLLQPIQILPRYKLLFGELIKALANDINRIKNVEDLLKACCKAEKQIQRLLDNVNEALSLNDIEEKHERTKSMFDLRYVFFGESITLGEPCSTFEFQLDLYKSLKCGIFDLMEQGKFKKMSIFTMFDPEIGRRFRGKAFLFEETLLCTEFIEKTEKLQYRVHISIDDIMFIDTDNKEGFKIITNEGRETDFYADLLKIQEWLKLLTANDENNVILRNEIKLRNRDTLSRKNSGYLTITSTDSYKSAFNRGRLSSNTVRITKREKLFQELPRVQSLISTSSSKSSSRSSSSSQNSYDLGGTKWYVSLDENPSTPTSAVKNSDQRKYLETLRNIEKHFILLLDIHKHGYLDSIPYYIATKLREFTHEYDEIMNYHTKNIYPVLAEHGMDIVLVCELFKRTIQDPVFHQIYKNYAILAPIAYDELNSHYINTDERPGQDLDVLDRAFLQNLDDFIELPLKHLRKYRRILTDLMTLIIHIMEIHREDISLDIMQMVANTEVEMSHFEKSVRDNFKIHSKKSLYIKVKSLGLIQYSDLVVMEYDDISVPRHRIFLMTNAILAVRIRNDTKEDDNEIFDTFIWTLPYELVQYRHSIKIEERIKIFSRLSKYQQYSIIFKSSEKKREFLRKLDGILENFSGFTSFVNEN